MARNKAPVIYNDRLFVRIEKKMKRRIVWAAKRQGFRAANGDPDTSAWIRKVLTEAVEASEAG